MSELSKGIQSVRKLLEDERRRRNGGIRINPKPGKPNTSGGAIKPTLEKDLAKV